MILQPVLEQFSTNCIKDSFTFAQTMQDLRLEDKRSICAHLSSLAYSTMYLSRKRSANVRKSCTKTLLSHLLSFKRYLSKNMESATSSVKFSFNDTMYKQTDGVAMGSPLGPVLTNIFVGYFDSKLFFRVQKLTIYFRYVDDTFAIFKQESDVDDFLVTLNRLHPALQFTFEKEHDDKLPFLDIRVERTELGFETSV